MKDNIKKIQILDSSMLKIIAMVIMVIDHTGAVLFPELRWMRIVGRIAFPIFAFFVAEGFIHTRNIKKYILRMAVFALISEAAFDLAFYGAIGFEHQNVMVTFLVALIGLWIFDSLKLKIGELPAYIVFVLVAYAAQLLRTDYAMYGVLLVFVYYVAHENFAKKHGISTLLQLVCQSGISLYSVISTPLLMLYNGRRGINLKYLFYAFYPAHLMVLYVLAGLMR